MKQEVWKDIQGYIGLYKISNHGRVMSMPKTWIAGNGTIFSHNSMILKLNKKNRNGYLSVMLTNNGDAIHKDVHRLVATTFLERNDDINDVNHKDGDKHNNCVDNLEWCSRSYNLKHAYKIGLKKKKYCSDHHNSKIVLDTETGVFYNSLTEAATFNNISYKNLSKYLSGYRKNKTHLIFA